jgi:hypothetical protein
MDNEGKPKKVLAEELESLRKEIARLHSLVLRNPAVEHPRERAEDFKEAKMHMPVALFDDSPLGMALVDNQLRVLRATRPCVKS